MEIRSCNAHAAAQDRFRDSLRSFRKPSAAEISNLLRNTSQLIRCNLAKKPTFLVVQAMHSRG